MVATCNDIRDLILKLRSQGIDIRVLFVDYAAKLASIVGDKEDFDRISNVYIDLSNLAEDLNLDIIWTANHITREGKNIELLVMMRMTYPGLFLLFVMLNVLLD